MTDSRHPSDEPPARRPATALEFIAASVLWLVIAALGWIVLVSWKPGWLRLPSVETEVVIVIGLLSAALVLVSVVALRQTRG